MKRQIHAIHVKFVCIFFGHMKRADQVLHWDTFAKDWSNGTCTQLM